MDASQLNYRHLFYFWTVAKAGSLTRASERLGLTPQTISTQLTQLEQSLGSTLFELQGRRLTPSEAGRRVLAYADEIFLLGEQLCENLARSQEEQILRLTVGITDVLPKLLAHRLLEPVFKLDKRIRLICHEGKFENLLADLALHKLDVVLADQPVTSGLNVRVFSHPLGESELSFFASPELAERHGRAFPKQLDGAPFLLPTRNNAIRSRLDHWFESHGIQPQIVAEFDDSALMMTFGSAGHGIFPAHAHLATDLRQRYAALPLGEIAKVHDQFYAISAERRITHPAIEALLAGGRAQLESNGNQ